MKTKFTLIELLVVAAIIAVLTSLLLPALGASRSYAKGTICMGNMKQIALTSVSYADSYDGTLPPIYTGATGAPFAQQLISAEGRFNGSSNWQDYPGIGASTAEINPKNKVFSCPSLAESPYEMQRHHSISDYGSNASHPHWVYVLSISPARKLTSIINPSRTMEFIDVAKDGASGSALHDTSWRANCPVCYPSATANVCDPRHRGGSNMAMIDGHGEWMSLGVLKTRADVWCCNASLSFR